MAHKSAGSMLGTLLRCQLLCSSAIPQSTAPSAHRCRLALHSSMKPLRKPTGQKCLFMASAHG